MKSIIKKIDEFYERMYSNRLIAILFSVATMNIVAILLSIVFAEDGRGYDPVQWCVVSILTGLFVFEVRKSRRAKKAEQLKVCS